MAEVLRENDPFCMTFGKDNWNEATKGKNKAATKQLTPKKKAKKMFEPDTSTDRARRSSQTQKKKYIVTNDAYKQNIDSNERRLHRTKAMSSLTDHQPKQLMDFITIRQEMQKKYSNDKLQKSTRKYSSMFDNELNKRLKDIETAAKTKIQRIRNMNEVRKMQSLYEPEIVFDKYKLISSQAMRRTKLTTVNPTINRYREEITKIDDLIHRVNARISSSTPKNTTDPVKRYVVEKA